MGEKRKRGKSKPQRKLKEFEVDVNVIDLDSYVAYHTKEYQPMDLNEKDFIVFTPEKDFLNNISISANFLEYEHE